MKLFNYNDQILCSECLLESCEDQEDVEHLIEDGEIEILKPAFVRKHDLECEICSSEQEEQEEDEQEEEEQEKDADLEEEIQGADVAYNLACEQERIRLKSLASLEKEGDRLIADAEEMPDLPDLPDTDLAELDKELEDLDEEVLEE